MKRGFAIHNHNRVYDRVKVSYKKLRNLYNVPQELCIYWNDLEPDTFRGRNPDDYYHLYFQDNGNYKLYPKEIELINSWRSNMDSYDIKG